ncbi:MAG: GIY-YIG nuclease family protein [Rhodanobacteraceae bacterium]
MLANDRNDTLYIGVTSDLIQRIWQHRYDLAEGFSKRYHTHNLVYFEQHLSMEAAILREKQIKKWNRARKLELIEKHNLYWRDLYVQLLEDAKDTGFPLSRE